MTKTRFMQSSAAFLIWAMKPGFFNMSGKNVDYKGCHAASLQDFAMGPCTVVMQMVTSALPPCSLLLLLPLPARCHAMQRLLSAIMTLCCTLLTRCIHVPEGRIKHWPGAGHLLM